MLLELRRTRALDGPVSGVVRAHRQLVDEQYRRPPRRVRRRARRRRRARSAIRMASCWAATAALRGRARAPARAPRRRCRRAGRSRRPGTRRPAPTATGPPRRPAPGAAAPAPRRSARRPGRAGAPRRPGRSSTQTPRPSYPPTTALADERHRPFRREVGHVRRAARRQAGTGAPSSVRRSRIARLFWAWRTPARRAHRDPLGDERADVLARHVLVVERDDVAALGEARAAPRDRCGGRYRVGGDEGGPVVGALREHAQRLAERDRRLVRHPGELAATHHAHHGQSGPGVHRPPA